MKTLSTFCIICLISGIFNTTNGQSILEDSGTLNKILKKASASASDSTTMIKILERYNAYEKPNEFLTDIIDLFPKPNKKIGLSESSGVLASSANSGLSKVFSPTAVVDGLGILLAERFKEEMTIAYLDGLIKKIDSLDSELSISVLMPSTVQTAKLIRDEIWAFKAYLKTLKEAIKTDMQDLPDNIVPFIKKQEGLTEKHYVILLVLDLGIQSANGTHPMTYFKDLTNDDLDDLGENNKPFFDILRLLSTSMVDADGDFLNKDYLKVFTPEITKLFVGLAMASAEKNGKLVEGTEELLEKWEPTIDKFATMIGQILALSSKANVMTDLTGDGKKIAPAEQIQFGLDALVALNKIANDLSILSTNLDTTYIKWAKMLLEIKSQAKAENYGLAVVKTRTLLELINTNVEGTPVPEKLIAFLKTYGMFLANMAEAKSGEEVKLALDAVVLPVGSYRLKRQNYSTVGVQAYPGVSVAYEQGLYRNNDFSGKAISLVAPIGIDFARGKKNTDGKKRSKARSWFVPLIDIGAVFGYHLGNKDGDEIDYSDDFEWKHVFTPGLYHVWHSRKVTSFGLGVQYNAFSLDISDQKLSVTDTKLVQVKFFLAADIPLLQLSSRKNKK